jgi:hypothetical protein
MTRRQLLALTGWWGSSAVIGRAQHTQHGDAPRRQAPLKPEQFTEPADITLRIAELSLELKPGRTVKTLAYNGQVPARFARDAVAP